MELFYRIFSLLLTVTGAILSAIGNSEAGMPTTIVGLIFLVLAEQEKILKKLDDKDGQS